MVPHKTFVEIVNMWVRLTFRVKSHLFISGTADKKSWILHDLNMKIWCSNDKKNNKHSNKQTECLLDYLRIWIMWLCWTKYFIMLCLHGVLLFWYQFCHFLTDSIYLKSWCLSNICILCIGALHSRSIRGICINHSVGINSPERLVFLD